jgi:hypothetical protein
MGICLSLFPACNNLIEGKGLKTTQKGEDMARALIDLGEDKRFEAETADVPLHLQAKVFNEDSMSFRILAIGPLELRQTFSPQALCA